jgi:hypothetical protein
VGRDVESLELFQYASDIERKVLEKKDELTLRSRYHIALAISENEKLDEALRNSKSVCEQRKSTLGEYHPDTLRSLLQSGRSYCLS